MYFHLEKELKIHKSCGVKDDQSVLENIRNLPKLRMLVEETQKDLKDSQQVIPFDQVGDYLQCLPVPGQPDSFITIQPFG